MTFKLLLALAMSVIVLVGCEGSNDSDSRSGNVRTNYSPQQVFAMQDAAHEILQSLKPNSAAIKKLCERYSLDLGHPISISDSDARNYPLWDQIFLHPKFGLGTVPVTANTIETRWEVCWIDDPQLISYEDEMVGRSRNGGLGVNTFLVMTWELRNGKPFLLKSVLLDSSTIPGAPKGHSGSAEYARRLLKAFSLRIPKLDVSNVP